MYTQSDAWVDPGRGTRLPPFNSFGAAVFTYPPTATSAAAEWMAGCPSHLDGSGDSLAR